MIDDAVLLKDSYDILSKHFQFSINTLADDFHLPIDVVEDIFFETPFSSMAYEISRMK